MVAKVKSDIHGVIWLCVTVGFACMLLAYVAEFAFAMGAIKQQIGGGLASHTATMFFGAALGILKTNYSVETVKVETADASPNPAA